MCRKPKNSNTSSVKSKAPSLGDCAALKKAIEPGFTIGSQKHNKGWGLDNIRTGSSSMHIISNSARLAVSDDNIEHVIPLDFNFKGTLLSYSVKLSQLEMEENVVDFEW